MMNSRFRYFTMIELLVVISIISILAGMLFPVLIKSKYKSRSMLCLSNEKQIAQAFIYYANDFGGNMVAGRMPQSSTFDVGNGYKWRPRWYAQIGISGKFYAFSNPSPSKTDDNSQRVDNKVFICPEEPAMDNGRNFGYGYNFQFLGNSRYKGGNAANGYINWPRKIDSIKSPSETVVFADCMGTAAGKANSSRLPYDEIMRAGSANTYTIGNHAWALDPPHLDVASDFCDDANRSAEHRSSIYPRHLNRANAAFLDGHADSLSLSDSGYEVLPDGSVGMNGNNRLFSGDSRDSLPPER